VIDGREKERMNATRPIGLSSLLATAVLNQRGRLGASGDGAVRSAAGPATSSTAAAAAV